MPKTESQPGTFMPPGVLSPKQVQFIVEKQAELPTLKEAPHVGVSPTPQPIEALDAPRLTDGVLVKRRGLIHPKLHSPLDPGVVIGPADGLTPEMRAEWISKGLAEPAIEDVWLVTLHRSGGPLIGNTILTRHKPARVPYTAFDSVRKEFRRLKARFPVVAVPPDVVDGWDGSRIWEFATEAQKA